MSEQAKEAVADELVGILRDRRASRRFSLVNACNKHGVSLDEIESQKLPLEIGYSHPLRHEGIEREPTSGRQRVIAAEAIPGPSATRRLTSWIGGKLRSRIAQWLLAALAGGLAAGLPLWLTRKAEQERPAQSIFQYLEDQGYHRANGVAQDDG